MKDFTIEDLDFIETFSIKYNIPIFDLIELINNNEENLYE